MVANYTTSRKYRKSKTNREPRSISRHAHNQIDNMMIGQIVYIKKHKNDLHWYKANLMEIRLKKRKPNNLLLTFLDFISCYSCRDTEYLVRLQNDLTLALPGEHVQSKI